MKNYKDSDYALNKYSGDIVYRFADGSRVTVTPADYLAENPGKTGADFTALKNASDEIYLDQVRAENAQTKKNTSLHSLEGSEYICGVPLEEEFIDAFDREAALRAFDALLSNGALTETQERRFRLRVFDGLTFREIAKHEGVAVRAVEKSVESARKLLIREFKKIA